jgi:hypothetical protein
MKRRIGPAFRRGLFLTRNARPAGSRWPKYSLQAPTPHNVPEGAAEPAPDRRGSRRAARRALGSKIVLVQK